MRLAVPGSKGYPRLAIGGAYGQRVLFLFMGEFVCDSFFYKDGFLYIVLCFVIVFLRGYVIDLATNNVIFG